MKRIWNSLGKNVKDGNFQKKAIEQVEKIEKGLKVAAPRYSGGESTTNSDANYIKKDLESKHHDLIGNVNKITVTSTEAKERWTSTKQLPTRESEYLHRNDPVWEYGFYEPPIEKIPKNKLMFREALEFLRARQELSDRAHSEPSVARRKHAEDVLSTHPVSSRVDEEKLADIFEYFRPFERKDQQKVVSRADLERLQDYLQGHTKPRGIMDDAGKNLKATITSGNRAMLDQYEKMDEKKKQEFREAVAQLREEEHQRLNQRLSQINEMEKTAKDAQATAATDKKTKKSTEDDRK